MPTRSPTKGFVVRRTRQLWTPPLRPIRSYSRSTGFDDPNPFAQVASVGALELTRLKQPRRNELRNHIINRLFYIWVFGKFPA